jgi:NAD(P)-dependent dehydrogenase (short-subunit alcohol dehydrogenase family)
LNTKLSNRKVAIVTGSATGVGAATALALSRRGNDLLINYSKSERKARQAEAACRDAGADALVARGEWPTMRTAATWPMPRWRAGIGWTRPYEQRRDFQLHRR